MKIVYLHQYFVTPAMAGGGRSYEMARRLVARGHEVHMVTSDQHPSHGNDSGWRETEEAGIRVHWTPVAYDNRFSHGDRIRSFLRFALRAAKRAADLRGDVVFATSTPLTIAIPAIYAARRSGCPLVFEVRDLWPAVPIAIGAIRNPVVKAGARWLERTAYSSSRHVIALAPGMRDEIVATGVPPGRVTVIPNGCDLDTFTDSGEGHRLRAAHAWLGDRPLLVFAGTFGLVNGMGYLVRLAEELYRLDPEIRIAAVGDGREFEATRQAALASGVLDRNLYLLGRRPKAETTAWIQAADMTLALFTGPEIVWRDAVQNKFFDSLAAGKPVANNFAGWQARIAEEAGAGIILSATDIPAAAQSVATHLRNEQWLQSAGSAAKRLARERFNRDDLAARLAEVLEAVVGEAG